MASANRYPGLDARIVAVVRHHARRTASRLPWLEVEDVEQELLLHVHRRLPAFRPERAGLATFVDRIARRHGATVVEAAKARKRCPGTPPLSLSAPAHGAEEDGVVGDTIADSDGLWASFGYPADEVIGLRHDLGKLLLRLTPPLRRICMALVDATVTEIAIETGRGRSSIYELLHRLRASGRDLGLDLYLAPGRTVPDPTR